ncbi:MAG: diguanylate cyclase [Eubacteriales bacterium]
MDRMSNIHKNKLTLYNRDEIKIGKNKKYYFDNWMFPIASKDEDIDYIGIVATDVTGRKNYEDQLKHLSLHDALTGIHNRTFFEREIKYFKDSEKYPLTFISIDANGLKIVNDTFGHNQGDQMLINLANIFKKSLRKSDILARVGGDEFIIVMPCTGRRTADMVAARIRWNIIMYNQENSSTPLSVSLGIATAEKPGDSLEDAQKKADDHMYHNKIFQRESSRSKIINSFLVALAQKDYIAQGHTQRLMEMCIKIGEKKKLSSEMITRLILLSQVHDIGKVSISDSILFKPGVLTEDEWEIMRQHSEKGYRIAASSHDLEMIANLIMRHHERWDGKGYPLGLKGEIIPMECRIFAILDAYDVMINERSYKKAMSKENAMLELKNCAGTQFDPEIINIFISVLAEEAR